MSLYRQKVEACMKTYEKTKNINIIKNFFTQLSMVAPIHLNCILYGYSNIMEYLPKHMDVSWLKHIYLKEFRNIVIFILYKDYETVVDETVYYDPTKNDSRYKASHNPDSPPTLKVQELQAILETVYYANHMNMMCSSSELPTVMFMFNEWIYNLIQTVGLPGTVYELFNLLVRLNP